MLHDTAPARLAAAGGRADVARLTLELRASIDEASAAEAHEVSIDVGHAVDAVRDRLAEQVEQRKMDLAAAVAVARLEAQALIAAAQRRTALMLDRSAPAATISSGEEWPTIGLSTLEPKPDAEPAPPAPASTITVVVDPAAFAEAFAIAFTAALADHLPDLIGSAAPGRRRVAPPRTELRHARHLDVFLVVVAALIVLVVLASWLS